MPSMWKAVQLTNRVAQPPAQSQDMIFPQRHSSIKTSHPIISLEYSLAYTNLKMVMLANSLVQLAYLLYLVNTEAVSLSFFFASLSGIKWRIFFRFHG